MYNIEKKNPNHITSNTSSACRYFNFFSRLNFADSIK